MKGFQMNFFLKNRSSDGSFKKAWNFFLVMFFFLFFVVPVLWYRRARLRAGLFFIWKKKQEALDRKMDYERELIERCLL